MRKKLYLIIFIAIIVVGIFLRFYDLGKTPSSLNWDEASWGYNAYSILKTGHDEHGALLPMSFEAFGDFKQPVYVYLTSISIGIFGLNPFAVRLPSAFFGILTIPFVWLLVYELFRKDPRRYDISLVSMFFFAISPWSIQFSRVAYEANVGLFFVIAGTALFLRGLYIKKYIISFISIILLSISCYTYHSEKLFTPLLFAGLLIFAFIKYKLSKKLIALFLVLFIVGNLLWIVDPRTTARGRSVTFFSNQTVLLTDSAAKTTYDIKHNDIFGEFLHNRRIVYVNTYIDNYLSHFSPNYLFVTGDNPRQHPFGMGILYLVSLPLILLGIIVINKKKYWIVFLWFLLAPLASSLAVDAPNASRSLVFLPTWQIFCAVGFVYILYLKKSTLTNIIKFLLFIFLLVNFTYYVHNYFSHTNSEDGIYWQSGYEEAMYTASDFATEGDKVFISPRYEQGYIFYLFYNSYSPAKYISSGGSNRIKKKCYSIDSVFFGDCNDKISTGDIYISQGDEKTSGMEKIGDIKDKSNIKTGGVYEKL